MIRITLSGNPGPYIKKEVINMKNNEMRVTPYKIEYSFEDGDEWIRYIRCFDSESELFHFASRLYV